MNESEFLGELLRRARVVQRRSQVEVAQAAGLSTSTLSLIENNWRRPSSEEAGRLCAVLEITLKDLELRS